MPLEGGILARLGRLPVIGNPAFRIADYRRLWVGAACNHLGMHMMKITDGQIAGIAQVVSNVRYVPVRFASTVACISFTRPVSRPSSRARVWR